MIDAFATSTTVFRASFARLGLATWDTSAISLGAEGTGVEAFAEVGCAITAIGTLGTAGDQVAVI